MQTVITKDCILKKQMVQIKPAIQYGQNTFAQVRCLPLYFHCSHPHLNSVDPLHMTQVTVSPTLLTYVVK